MWVLIYAFLGFLYFLASIWKPIFSTIGIKALFPVYTFINIFASFCIYFYHDFRKEPCKNKWYKFVLGNLLTVVLFVGLFFGYAVFACKVNILSNTALGKDILAKGCVLVAVKS